MSGIGISERRQSRATWRALWIGATLLVLAGIWWAESPAAVLAYMLVVAASLLPTVLWISRGRAGVPILPALAGGVLRATCLVALIGLSLASAAHAASTEDEAQMVVLDNRFGESTGATSIGDRRSDHHVVGSRIAVQQGRQGGQEHHETRGSLPPGDPPDEQVTCPCLWKEDALGLRPLPIPKYNNENRWYIEKYQAILGLFD